MPEPDWEKPIATAECDVLDVDGAVDNGLDVIMVADSHDQELYDVAEALFPDGSGMPLQDLRFESTGNVMYIARLEVDPNYDFEAVSRQFLEAIIEDCTSGCAVVAYILGGSEPAIVRDVLEERGFRRIPSIRSSEKFSNIWIADAKAKRPPL